MDVHGAGKELKTSKGDNNNASVLIDDIMNHVLDDPRFY